jgi:hypothetical protein
MREMLEVLPLVDQVADLVLNGITDGCQTKDGS